MFYCVSTAKVKVLRALERNSEGLTMSEIAAQTRLPLSRVCACLNVLRFREHCVVTRDKMKPDSEYLVRCYFIT